jgi:hypothetical protein
MWMWGKTGRWWWCERAVDDPRRGGDRAVGGARRGGDRGVDDPRRGGMRAVRGPRRRGIATSRSTTPGQASHPALWAVIEHSAGLPPFGGGKPRLSATSYLDDRCPDHGPQCCGLPRCVANVVLLVPATLQSRDNATLRGGLPAPNSEDPQSSRSQPRERGGLPAPASWIIDRPIPADEMARRHDPHPWSIATSLSARSRSVCRLHHPVGGFVRCVPCGGARVPRGGASIIRDGASVARDGAPVPRGESSVPRRRLSVPRRGASVPGFRLSVPVAASPSQVSGCPSRGGGRPSQV